MNPDSIHAERMLDLQGAKELLGELLRDGKRAGRFDLADLIELEINSERYRILLQEFADLLLNTGPETAAKADLIREGFIERFLSANEDLIHEQAEEELG